MAKGFDGRRPERGQFVDKDGKLIRVGIYYLSDIEDMFTRKLDPVTGAGTNSFPKFDSAGEIIDSLKTIPSGDVVGTSDSQTLTNKTLTTPIIADFTSAQHDHQDADDGGKLDHGLALNGLTDDDHTQYALLAGRSGGQVLKGGTASGDNLTLRSTDNITRGKIIFGTSGYDEVNNQLGIGTSSPSSKLEVYVNASRHIRLYDSATGGAMVKVLSDFGANPLLLLNGTGAADLIRADDNGTTVFAVKDGGNIGIGTGSPTISDGAGLDINGKLLRVRTAKTPASAGATGNAGEICWDADYLYVCTATNTWKRAGIASW